MGINNLDRFIATTQSARTCVGLVVTLADPAVSELAGDAGYDFTWIDMEHAPHTLQTVMGHVMAVRGTGCAPFVRVPWNEHGIIKPVLDLAPAGVIIPMVNSAELAAAAVSACRYPLAGTRGCGLRRGNRYGAMPFPDYLEQSRHEPLVIVQIEHVDAVSNLDEILAVPGIGSVCVGPCDLSGSMGKLNELDDPEVNRVLDEICRKVKSAGIMLGTAGAPFERWRRRGVDWIALTSDCGSIFGKAQEIIGQARATSTVDSGEREGDRRR